jgi:Transposase DDE domain
LVGSEPVAAVDATGLLEARHVSAHFGTRRGGTGHRQRAWPKLTAVVHTASHLIVGAVPGVGPGQDSPDFAPAVRQAAGLVAFDAVLADAGYDAEHNHRPCREELGMRRAVIALNPRNGGERWPKAPYRRALRLAFPSEPYGQRWHAESAFSQHKRRLGSALTARGGSAQQVELVLRALTHNLALLATAA